MKKRSKVGANSIDAGSDALQRGATVRASGRLKIIVMSHSHPAISKGGAEIAAYQHFSMLKEMGHEAVFRAGSVCLNSLRSVAKWISALVMPQPGLAAAR